MLDKIRTFAGDGATHIMAGVFATFAHDNPWMAALFVFTVVLLLINYAYHGIQHMRGCKTPQLCAIRIKEEVEKAAKAAE